MVKSYTITLQGGRPYQEDNYTNIELDSKNYFCGVFDGHGGDAMSIMCKDLFPVVLNQGISASPHDICQSIKSSFYVVDEFARNMNNPGVGSTVVFTLITKETIWFANAGDSIAIVGYNDNTCEVMSQEHKVENEKERITHTGGTITYFDGIARVNGNLNVSRSIGDHYLKKWVICEPYVRSVSLRRRDVRYIFLASDGISVLISAKSINDIINSNIDFDVFGNKEEKIKEVISAITKLAQNLGSTDNITATYVVVDTV